MANQKKTQRDTNSIKRAVYQKAWDALEGRTMMSVSTWTGAGGDANFSTAGNWQGNAVPQTGDDIVFPAGAASQVVNIGSHVTVGSMSIGAGGYSISGSSVTISGGVSASGSSSLSSDLTLANSQTITIAGGTLTLAGNVDDAGSSYGLTKAGSGTLDITGSGTYSGSTTVSAGTLEVDGTLSSGINLAAGATLDGNGLVGSISSTGGTVSPGLGGNAGLLSDSGGLTLDSNSTLSLQLDGNAAGTGSNFYGQVSTGNGVVLNGAALSLNLGPDYTPAAGDVLTLISNGGTSTTGTFAGLAEGATLTLGNNQVFRISYVGGTGGHDTTLSFVRTSGVTLTSSAGPSVIGQSVTFTATVAPGDGQPGTPTGTVTFYDNGVAIGSAQTLDGSAHATVASSSLTLGTHSITATYGGDSHFRSANTASALSQTVNADATSTTLSSSTGGASVWGQSVTFTATVAATAPGSGNPAGTVQFYADGVAVGSPVTLSSGTATYTTAALTVGARSITAAFTSAGSNYNSSSTGSALTQTVSQSTTATTVTSSSLNSVVGQAIVLTATVNPAGNGAGVRTGTVTFKDGGTTIGTGTVNASGVATYTTSALALASHTITAVYGGDTHFLTSTSAGITQVVAQAASRVLVSTSATPSVYGQAVTLSVSVAAQSPGSGTPTGTVTFNVDGNSIGTASLSGGHASMAAGALAVGSHVITVAYAGDSNYTSASSANVTQIVNLSPVTVSVSSGSPTAVFGQTVAYSVTVAPSGNGSGTPTGGTVTLTDENSNVVGTGTLSGGAVSINVSTLAVGSHTITASYAGNGSYASGTSSTASQTINAASTTTTVTSSGTTSVAGQSVTFTAAVTVNAPGGGTVAGTVAFYDNDLQHQIGTTQPVSAGSAAVTTTALTHGSHTVFAVYTPASGSMLTSTSSSITQTDNQDTTTTAVTNSSATTVYGQTATFTATVSPVAPGGGTPTGTITFYDGGTQLGSPVALTGGAAHLDVTTLSVASHNITAVYSGDVDYATSNNNGNAVVQTVNQAATATVITADASPSKFDQSVTFTATVNISGAGSGTRTGTVTFTVDGNAQSPVNLSGNTATLTLSNLAVGGHTVTAAYSGDGNFVSSAASTFNHTVQKSDTTTVVTSSAPSAVYGQLVTLTATVAPTAPGGGTPNTGTVTFYSDGNSIGTGTTSGGTTTLANVTLPVGTHAITATYAGNGNYTTSTSAPTSQVYAQAATALVTTAPTTVVFGQTATLTATLSITGNGAGVPTGNIVFTTDGGTVIGTQAVSGGTASITVSTLSVATHAVVATYVGDANFLGAAAPSVNQIVNKSDSAVAVVSSSTLTAGTYHSVYGETATFTATITAAGNGVGTPTGTVTFKDGSTVLGTGTLSGGVATFASTTLVNYLSVGSHSITATYGGDGNFNTADSTGSPITQSVAQASTTTTVTSSLGTSVFGQAVTFTATVAPQSPANGTPTGTVTFYSNGVQIGTTQTLSGGAASVQVSTLAVATQTITAVYNANANYATSTSANLTQTVNPANTTMTVATSDTAPVAGETITLTATVAPTAGTGVPTGAVTFYDNGNAIGSAQSLTNGTAAVTTTLTVGAHNITANYANVDGNFNNATTASATSVPVVKDAVTVGLTQSAATTVFGQSTNYTAAVTSNTPGSGTPTGTVTFYSDGTQIGSPVALSAGSATLAYGSLAVASHTITAAYNGDGNYLAGLTGSPVTHVVNQADSTVTLGATTNSVYGSNATFTATLAAVAPGAGVATGTVTFYANGTSIGQSTASGGVATLSVNTLAYGDWTITAGYGGDGHFHSSTTASGVTQHVGQSPTTTTLAVSSASDVWGQSVTFTATVAPSGGGAGAPDGTVFFIDGSNVTLGAVDLSAGQAVFTTTALSVGSHSIRAVYATSNNPNYTASNSSPTSVTIAKAATSLGLTSSAATSTWDQSVTFTANVAPTAPGAGSPTGTVTIYSDGNAIGSGSVDVNGVFTVTTSALSVATHNITAGYAGDANFLTATATPVSQVVNQASVGVAVTSTAQNNAVFGQSVTLTATLTAVGTPTGTVQFYDNGVALGSPVTVAGGAASYVTSSLTTASHVITAAYSGDGNYLSQTSPSFTQTINPSATTTAVVSNHANAVAGQAVTFTATVTAAGQGAGTPTGTVNFYADGTALGSAVSMTGNTATISTSTLTTAGHQITAVYSGDTNFTTSTSPALTQSEAQASSTVVLTTAAANSVYGINPTLTATVSITSPGTGTATGTVTFYDGTGNNAVSLGQGTLSNGVATLTNYTLAAGSHTLSVVYSGDTNFITSTSSTVTQTVAQAATAVSLTTPASGEYGQSMTLSASVSLTTGSGVPTGSIGFYDGSTLLGSVPMTAGAASLNHAFGVGTHNITATYVPTGGNFAGSTTVSASTITTAAATTSTTLSAPTPTVAGQSASFTATVAITGNGVGTFTGSVGFYDGQTLLGTVNVTNGQATYTTASLSVASHTITAVYGSDPNFATSTAPAVTQVVSLASVTEVVTSTAASASFGQSVTLTAAFTAVAPGAGVPTGTVTFMDGSTTLGAATLDNTGHATYTSAAFAVGGHAITAVYGGDANFATLTTSNFTQTVTQAATTTTVVSDHPTSVAGQTVTFTATLAVTAPGAGTPTGTITFFADGTAISSAVALTGTTASFSTSALSTAGHPITAVYSGDTHFVTSTSTALTQTVAKASTTVALASANTSTAYGTNPVLTATVSVTLPGVASPAGTVNFYDGQTLLGTGNITGGVATLSTYTLAAGSHTLTAVYAGDTDLLTSTSTAVTQTVTPAATAVTLTAPASGEYGQSLALTAAVTLTTGAGVPTGSIAFYDGSTLLSTVPMTAGSATLNQAFTVAAHHITATYVPTGGNFAASTSAASTIAVAAASTTTTLSATTNTVAGQSVTFTAAVAISGNGVGTLTGTVSFYDGQTLLGTANLSGGQATYTLSTLSVGSHTITAVYGSDPNFSTSTASAVTQTVAKSSTSTTVTSVTTTTAIGTAVTFTAAVGPVAPGTGVATGTVTFKNGSTVLGTGTLDNTGHATYTTSALPLGTDAITAVYAGDTSFLTSTASTFTETITRAVTTTTLTSTAHSTVWGQSVTLSATLVGTGGGALTGTVTFMDGSTQLGTANYTGSGAATLTLSTLAVGTHNITAVFAGSTNYAGSTSTALSQVVAKASVTNLLTTSADSLIPGTAVTLTATLAPVTPGAGTLTGTVNFYDGTTLLGTGTITGGVATYATAGLTSGDHSITAAYSGDAHFNTLTTAASVVHVTAPGTIGFGSAAFSANESGGTATVTVTRAAGTEGAASVDFSVTGGTAVNGTDYTLSAGTLNFADGQSTATITVPITNDGRFGTDKTVTLALTNPTAGATLSSATTATLTIHDDNPQPTVSVTSPTVTEGADGTAVATFNVTLSAPADVPVQVSYTTVDGTANAGSYASNAGTLTFAPGVTTQTVSVAVLGTNSPGTPETFGLSATGANTANGTATVINNNFAAPTVSDVSASATPGSTMTFNPLASAVANDGGPLTLSVLAAPGFGTAAVTTVNGQTVLAYTPGAGAIETDSFTYQVTDSHGRVSVATATVNYAGAGLVASSLNPGKTDLVVVGTAGNDVIKLGQVNTKKFKVVINNVTAGTYSPTGRIFAFGGAGNDSITATGITRQVFLYGDAGNDTLTGGNGSDLLVGGDGSDKLAGGPGRNLLIGGNGADSLKGSGTDLLVSGATDYDGPNPAAQAALNSILSDWMNHKKDVFHSVGANPGGPHLDATTVTDDGSADVLTGKASSWYFGDFSFSGGNDTFNDGRKPKHGQPVTPTNKELVTNLG